MEDADKFREWFKHATDDLREDLFVEVAEQSAEEQLDLLTLPRDFRKGEK